MAKVNKLIGKGIALATLVTAAVALAHALKKNKKAKLLKAAAQDAKETVMAHAKKLGGVSKKAYDRIVDTVVAEYGQMRTLSKQELGELTGELKAGWKVTSKKIKGKK